jgi:hypothetical protein
MEPDDQAESLAIIDVEAEPFEPIDNFEPESTEKWYSAVQIQGLLRVSKAGLQQSIAKLTTIYGIDLKVLRRGSASSGDDNEAKVLAL